MTNNALEASGTRIVCVWQGFTIKTMHHVTPHGATLVKCAPKVNRIGNDTRHSTCTSFAKSFPSILRNIHNSTYNDHIDSYGQYIVSLLEFDHICRKIGRHWRWSICPSWPLLLLCFQVGSSIFSTLMNTLKIPIFSHLLLIYYVSTHYMLDRRQWCQFDSFWVF